MSILLLLKFLFIIALIPVGHWLIEKALHVKNVFLGITIGLIGSLVPVLSIIFFLQSSGD